jgi:hypothetical protein
MIYCTLTEKEMQAIEDKSNKKLSQLLEELKWEPAVGDLVRQKHGLPIIGLITHIQERQITVHWQRPNPNNVSGKDYEVLEARYLELFMEAVKK